MTLRTQEVLLSIGTAPNPTSTVLNAPSVLNASSVLHGWRPPVVTVTATRVVAILVARDGAACLPRTLDALHTQTRPPDVLIGVDAGSGDTSAELLEMATPHVVTLARGTFFGDAVHAATVGLDGLALTPRPHPRPDGPVASVATEDAGIEDAEIEQAGIGAVTEVTAVTEWLWLLHADSAPAPDCLERLLAAVDGGPSIGVAGCKQVSWHDPRRLLDVGFTTSRFGTRVTGVDPGDLDQGQLDHRSDVLAVGTAGMLIRRELWQSLGGFDPALARARADLDLCRRAHLDGARVVVVPEAVVASAAIAGGRRGAVPPRHVVRHDRQAAVHLRLAAAPRPMLPFLLVWTGLATLVRALARLALKQPERAWAELAGWFLAVTRPWAWLRARRRYALPRKEYRRLLANGREVARQRREQLAGHLRRRDEAHAARFGAGNPADDPTDAGAADGPDEIVRSGPTSARVLTGLVVTHLVVALAGLRGLLPGAGGPEWVALGPALDPVPQQASQLWELAWSPWRPVGLGAPGVGDPLPALLALPAWLLGSGPDAARLLLLLALPMAAGSAWWAAGCATGSRALRAWAAGCWAASPPLLAAVATGRLGAVLAHVLLPVTVLALVRAVDGDGRSGGSGPGWFDRAASARRGGSLPAASAAGLALTALLAAAPSLAVPAALVLGTVLVLAAPRARMRLLWTAAIPAVVLLPWWVQVASMPRLLLAEPGGAGTSPEVLDAEGPVPWPFWPALGWPGDPAALAAGPLPELAATVGSWAGLGAPTVLRLGAGALATPLICLALLALYRDGRRGGSAAAAWLLGLVGLAVALLAPLLVRRAEAGQVLHAWPGTGVSLLTLGLLGAAVLGLNGAAGRLRARPMGWRHPGSVIFGAAATSVPLLIICGWALTGWVAAGEPGRAARVGWVHLGRPDVAPAVAAAEAEGPAGARTLVLRVARPISDGTGQVSWSLLRAGGPRLGMASAAAPGQDDPVVQQLVAGLLAGTDQRGALASAGVGSVLLLGPAAADQPDAAALDTAAGLVRVARHRGGVLWRVEQGGPGSGPTRPARVRVLSGTGAVMETLAVQQVQVEATVSPGPAGRRLVLAERADPRWRATLDGQRLQPLPDGWAQAFRLPATSSSQQVAVWYRSGLPPGTGLAQAAVAGTALLLALPLTRRRRTRAERWPAAPTGHSTGSGSRPAGRRRQEATGTVPS